MIAEPPFDSGATQVRRSWPEAPVGAAVNERGAVGNVRGIALAVLLAGLCPATLRA